MPISDKTRKLLWGKSGNRCAICRSELVIEATSKDDESVVGVECHIVSGKPQGPRYDPTFPASEVDEYPNLVLLCGVHHKMIDDQFVEYSAAKVQALKNAHETWVTFSLSGRPDVRIRRVKQNVPTHLRRLLTGREIFSIINGACEGVYDNDDPGSPEEASLFGDFLQETQDLADLSNEMEPKEQVNAVYRINTLLQELEQEGYWVFGAKEIKHLEIGGNKTKPWPSAILRIVHATDANIMAIEPEKGDGDVSEH